MTGTALKLEHIDLPLAAGSKVTIWHPDTFSGFGDSPFSLSQGYTFDVGGVLWRGVLQTVSSAEGGTLMELEIEGRYADLAPSAPDGGD